MTEEQQAKPEQRYSIFQAPAMCFFSRAFYVDVIDNWRGIGLTYFLLLFSVTWLLVTLRITMPMFEMARDYVPKLTSQMPRMTFTDYKLSIDKESPYILKEPGTDFPIALFDTSGTKTEVLPEDPVLIFTEQEVMQHKISTDMDKEPTGGDIMRLKYSEMEGVMPRQYVVDKNGASDLINTVLAAIPFAIFVGWGGVLLFTHFGQVLIYAGIAEAVAAIMKMEMTFPAAMRLAVMAITPNILLSTILTTCNHFDLPNQFRSITWPAMTIVIALAYVIFGCNAVAASHRARTPSES